MNEDSRPKYAFAKQLMLLFIGLKLTNYIDWSWWWVTSPLWIAAVLNPAVDWLDKKITALQAELQTRVEKQ